LKMQFLGIPYTLKVDTESKLPEKCIGQGGPVKWPLNFTVP